MRTLAIAALLGLVGAPCAAQPRQTARLDYRVADGCEGCPSERGFRDIVASRLGYDPFTDDDDRRTIAIEISQRPDDLSGRVQTLDAHGVVGGAREMSASLDDCPELARSMAIVVSLLLDPLGLGAPPVVEPIEPEPSSPPEPEPDAPTPALPEPGPELRWILAVGGHLTLGWVPDVVTLGPALRVGLRVDQWSAHLSAAVELMPSVATVDSGDRIDATIITGGAHGCFHFDPGLACLGAQLGGYQGTGVDLVDAAPQTSFFATIDLAGGLTCTFDGFYIAALAELRVAPVRPSLVIDGTTVWSASPVGGGIRIWLGVSIS